MDKPKEITLVVVDDHPLMRIGICATINAQDDMQVVAQAGTGEQAVAEFHRLHPDVILMDMGLPGMSGLEAIHRICECESSTSIVAITMYEGDEDIYQALKAGAEGYVLKGMPHEVMLDAIRSVHRGESFLPPPVAHALRAYEPERELRRREKEVLALIVAGMSNREIALELGITERTVKCHVTAILLRLGVIDRTQAAITALKRGMVHL